VLAEEEPSLKVRVTEEVGRGNLGLQNFKYKCQSFDLAGNESVVLVSFSEEPRHGRSHRQPPVQDDPGAQNSTFSGGKKKLPGPELFKAPRH
jgi:hypothetical protein